MTMQHQNRKIIHIDMDSFYASVEMRDQPHLKNQPVAVGGDAARRGVICTANYVARKYGVRSAMATAYALRICPQLVILPVDMQKYRLISEEIKKIFYEYTHLVEPLSLDEAYLDVSDCQQQQGSATWIAEEIRQRIKQQFQLTASAGVAANKFLAKIASDWRKPDGLFVIPPKAVSSFILTLPVDKLFGVGKVTANKLHQNKIFTCADLQKTGLDFLEQHFGKFGKRLHDMSFGLDDRVVNPQRIRKSLSVETTFVQDIAKPEECVPCLQQLYEDLMHRLSRYQEREIANVIVKIKFHDFTGTTVQRVIAEPKPTVDNYQNLLTIGYNRKNAPMRLIGIGVDFR